MRIVFVVNQFPVLSETFVLNQITGLIDRGQAVDIYAARIDHISKVHPDVEKYRLLERTFSGCGAMPADPFLRVLKGLRLLLANCRKNPLALLRSLNVFKYGKQAASLRLLYTAVAFLGNGPYDIIHCQFGTLGTRGIVLRDIVAPRAKLITSFRGYDISRQVEQAGDGVYNRLFAVGDFFLPNCEYFKHRLLKLGCNPKKIVVHRSGIDCSRFSFTLRDLDSDRLIRITTVGRLVEKKGIEYSIRAIGKLAKANQNIEYNIIGNGPLREDLQQLIQELDVSDRVKLLGWKQQEEIIETLNNSQLFVAPSVTAKDGDQDAPVNVLKEAMAMGLPIISTNHGGIPELVENGISGYLVPERDPDAIAERLSYLIEHPQVWPKMSLAGRAQVEQHYDVNKLNDQLVELYQRQLDIKIEQELEPDLWSNPNVPETKIS